MDGYRWVGFENYLTVFRDPEWWQAVRNTVLFVAISVPAETLLGLLVAVLLVQNLPGRGLLRAAILVPWVIPTVISAKMWTWMFHDLYGVVNDLGLRLGWFTGPKAWLVEDGLLFGSMIFVDVWKTTPFMALLLMAGLETVPKETLEAARLESRSSLRVFLKITLPLLKPALIVAVLFRTLDALRVFDLIYVFTNNKPSLASMASFARRQLVEFQELGIGSAASMFVFVIVGVTSVLVLLVQRRNQARAGVGVTS